MTHLNLIFVLNDKVNRMQTINIALLVTRDLSNIGFKYSLVKIGAARFIFVQHST